ncbi:glycosyltransferase [Paenibacillus sp. HJL G12]|uniref:Glycosyltransferase n=1 Tax=Paenibacillus dendrobii TaxID=2691084 RepID=A0A7X3LGF2_9BACL|nr:glycosyltransferase [Paenibacillus dendrobii]MWV42443.1 glycosyltransferase [Paenibacillus dendrobii]
MIKAATPPIPKPRQSKKVIPKKRLHVQSPLPDPVDSPYVPDQSELETNTVVSLNENTEETETSRMQSHAEESGLYDVFRFPVIDWESSWQRPQQFSQQFALHGHRVFYMTTGVAVLQKEHATYEEVSRHVKIKRIEPNVWLITLCANRRLDLYRDQMSAADIQYLKWSTDYVMDRFHIEHLVSIVDLPFWTPLVTAMENHKLLYDCMDELPDFSTNDKSILKQEERLAREADLVLASSQLLYGRMNFLHSSVLLLRNGTDNEAVGLASLARTTEDFEQAIERSLQDDDPEQIDARKQCAAQHTWEMRYQELHQVIFEKLFPKVSIVLLTYNNWPYTRQCLLSLQKPHRYPNLEIIIIDNGSTDETLHHLSELDPDLFRIIYSSSNLGFAAGTSLGCRKATGEYIILLNNDTIPPDGSWIRRLIRPLEQNQEIGMTGPMSNHVGNDQTVDHFAGNPIEGANPHWLQDFYDLNKGSYRYTDVLGFFCVAMKRSVFEKVGGLDSNYGIGMFEDDDYCEQVKRAGFKLAVIEDAFVYHHGSSTIKKFTSDEHDTLWKSSKAYYERKWNKPWQMPKRPDNLFIGADTPEEIAARLNKNDHPCTLVLGGVDWSRQNTRWQQIVKQLAADQERIIIVYLNKYHHHDMIGIRKAGPHLYLTNRLDLFAHVPFESTLYCGETNVLDGVQSQRNVIDACSYHAHQLSELRSKLTAPAVFEELQVAFLVRQIMETTLL